LSPLQGLLWHTLIYHEFTGTGDLSALPASSQAARAARSPVVLLLAAVLFLNYVDRGALPTAVQHIQVDLHLTSWQLGVLLSAFFWTYTTIQIPIGALAERHGAHRVLAVGLTIWALATMLVSVAWGYYFLLLLRLMLGVGESVSFPCASKILASTVPNESLGRANGIIAFAYLLGPAAGLYAGGLLIESYGWRAMFVVFGLGSLLWLWPWSRVTARQGTLAGHTTVGATTSNPIVPTGSATQTQIATLSMILRQRSLWGTGLGHFASNYTFYFMLSWLPYYLVAERGFSDLEMTHLAGSAYLVNAVFAMIGGWAVDRYIAGGGSANIGYKVVMGGAQLVAIACMLCMAVGPRPVALVSIFTYEALCGLSSPGVFAVSQILAGPPAAGRWVGVQNTIGNLAGIVAPALTGFVFDWTGHFTLAFVLAAVVGVLGFVGWVFMIPHISELTWGLKPQAVPLSHPPGWDKTQDSP
jgi:MFS family permease